MATLAQSDRKRILRAALTPWLAAVALLGLWQWASQAGWLPVVLFSSPSAVARAAQSVAASGELWAQIQISLLRAVVPLLAGGGLGLALGVLNGLSRTSAGVLDAALRLLGNVTVVAFIPLLLLGAGVQEGARLTLLSAGVFFPVYLGVVHGIRGVDPALIEMARAAGLTGWPLLRDVMLPGALPSLLSGLRVALALLWGLLIAVEALGAQSGIGSLATRVRDIAPADLALLAVVLYVALGKATDVLVSASTRRLLRWAPAVRRAGAY